MPSFPETNVIQEFPSLRHTIDHAASGVLHTTTYPINTHISTIDRASVTPLYFSDPSYSSHNTVENQLLLSDTAHLDRSRFTQDISKSSNDIMNPSSNAALRMSENQPPIPPSRALNFINDSTQKKKHGFNDVDFTNTDEDTSDDDDNIVYNTLKNLKDNKSIPRVAEKSPGEATNKSTTQAKKGYAKQLAVENCGHSDRSRFTQDISKSSNDILNPSSNAPMRMSVYQPPIPPSRALNFIHDSTQKQKRGFNDVDFTNTDEDTSDDDNNNAYNTLKILKDNKNSNIQGAVKETHGQKFKLQAILDSSSTEGDQCSLLINERNVIKNIAVAESKPTSITVPKVSKSSSCDNHVIESNLRISARKTIPRVAEKSPGETTKKSIIQAKKGYVIQNAAENCGLDHKDPSNFLPETQKSYFGIKYYLHDGICFGCNVKLCIDRKNPRVFCCTGPNGNGIGNCKHFYCVKCYSLMLK